MSVAAGKNSPLTDDLDHVLRHTAGLWEELPGRNIFVTGGTGFFGRWLLESFAHANATLNLGARLFALTRQEAPFRNSAPYLCDNEAITFVRGDVRTFTLATIRSQLPQTPTQFHFVIHAATEASAKLNAEDPSLMFDTIVEGTRAALQFAVEASSTRFLFTSSGAVYGPQPSTLAHIPEDYSSRVEVSDSLSAYAAGKRAAEVLCADFHHQHGIDPLIARCFAFVGPGLPLDTHFAIGNFIRDALAGGPIRVGGDGTPFRSYLYAADLAIWLWTILLKGNPCYPYNVGSAEDFTIAQIADAVRDAIEPSIAIEIALERKPGASAFRYVPDTSRAREELGLAERIPLRDAIQRTARYAKAIFAS